MKLKVMILVMAALPLLVINACSSQQEKKEPEGYLATHIDENGSKLFQYSLDIQAPENGQRGSNNTGQPGKVAGHVSGNSSRGVAGGITLGSNSGKPGRKSGGNRRTGTYQAITSKLENMLEQELKTTGYCRDGYTELERVIGASAVFIMGECNETIISEDGAVSMLERR
jgi:hypothetical protein